ncbi:MAG: hypothetical protein IJH91_02795 [Mogibacterium sp.]|nr:hypothetical protein [Mogibacterium sp.]
METNDFPSKGLYLGLTIFGFLCGILWGILSIGPYRNMSAAIEAGDAPLAQAYAKKIRTYVIIGVIVNVILLFMRSR